MGAVSKPDTSEHFQFKGRYIRQTAGFCVIWIAEVFSLAKMIFMTTSVPWASFGELGKSAPKRKIDVFRVISNNYK